MENWTLELDCIFLCLYLTYKTVDCVYLTTLRVNFSQLRVYTVSQQVRLYDKQLWVYITQFHTCHYILRYKCQNCKI